VLDHWAISNAICPPAPRKNATTKTRHFCSKSPVESEPLTMPKVVDKASLPVRQNGRLRKFRRQALVWALPNNSGGIGLGGRIFCD